jgi:hypothetical protein
MNYRHLRKPQIFIRIWRNMKTILPLILGVALLTGCAETVYRTQLEVYCPPLQSYDQEWNESLAEELETLGEDYAFIPMVIADYAKLRDKVRRCEQEKEKL